MTSTIISIYIFRILDGAHIPSGGQTSAQAQVTGEAGEPKEYEYEYYDDTPLESPFVNPHDPNHQNVSWTHADLYFFTQIFDGTFCPIINWLESSIFQVQSLHITHPTHI